MGKEDFIKTGGKTIAKVEYLSPKEGEEMMWYKLPLAITFTDGSWIFPMADDEGNDGGSLATSIRDWKQSL